MHKWRMLVASVGFGAALATGTMGTLFTGNAGEARAAAGDVGRARIQMFRNGLRGLSYLPLWRPGNGGDPATFDMRVRSKFALDGDATTNVRSNFYPIDVGGDGTYELFQYNGSRLMRVFRQDGTKLWEKRNPSGRVHRSAYHRDNIAVFNSDGIGGQDIVTCYAASSSASKRLEIRSGSTGTVLRSVALTGDSGTSECQLAALQMTGRSSPIILVSRTAPGSANCRGAFIDNFSMISAFDTKLRPLWTRTNCDAGHYVWPLDSNRDGVAEAVFVGKYLYNSSGTRICTLPGWGREHVDSMVIANFRSDLAGHEVVAVGVSGTRAYRAANCSALWTIPTSRIPNPQVVTAARTAANPVAPWIFVQERGDNRLSTRRIFRLNPTGGIVSSYSEPREPTRGSYQTVNLDGDLGGEDRVGAYGRVFNNSGGTRLGTEWYRDLQNLTAAEERLIAAEKWSFTPLFFDLDRNGRDEMITWGRKLLVIGSRG